MLKGSLMKLGLPFAVSMNVYLMSLFEILCIYPLNIKAVDSGEFSF